MTRVLLSASALLTAALLLSGCESSEANVEESAPPGGSVLLGELSFPFSISTCLNNPALGPQQFVIFGGGTATDGRPFDVHADGQRGRIELRIKGESGSAAAIYTASFEPGMLQLQSGAVSADGLFQRIVGGGRIDGHFEARCPTS